MFHVSWHGWSSYLAITSNSKFSSTGLTHLESEIRVFIFTDSKQFKFIRFILFIIIPPSTFNHVHLPSSFFNNVHLPSSTFNHVRLSSSTFIHVHLPLSTLVYLHLRSFTFNYVHLPSSTFPCTHAKFSKQLFL